MPDVELQDIETMLIPFVAQHSGVPAHTLVPKNRPDEFVRVWRTGGTAVNQALEEAQVTVECWGKTTIRAAQIAQKARGGFLRDLKSLKLVRGSQEVTGPYYDPDPDTGIPRYSFTIRLSVRAKRIEE